MNNNDECQPIEKTWGFSSKSIYTDDLYQLFLKDLQRESLMTREEEIMAGKAIFKARKGVAILVKGNIRLVINNTKKYTGQKLQLSNWIASESGIKLKLLNIANCQQLNEYLN